EPVLEVGVEAVLRPAALQVQEAEDERAGEAEQRGRERDAHAAERRAEPFLEGIEHLRRVAAHLQALDHGAHRGDGLYQAPERAEQAEEDEEAGHVARDVARLVEAGGDREPDTAHWLPRHAPAAPAGAPERLPPR